VFNTGMSNGVALNTGATDPNFVLVAAPPGAGTSALVINPSDANNSYTHLPDSLESQWVGPDTTDAYEPAGVYHYQLQFLVCCTNAELNGQMAADNLAGVYLNDNYVAEVPALSPPCSSWTPIGVVGGFVLGLNTLDIYVTNWTSSVEPGYSPTGFRAELTNCCCRLLVSCPTNKTVQCAASLSFDTPTASSCCGQSHQPAARPMVSARNSSRKHG
jgi:hypothetical protein